MVANFFNVGEKWRRGLCWVLWGSCGFCRFVVVSEKMSESFGRISADLRSVWWFSTVSPGLEWFLRVAAISEGLSRGFRGLSTR